MFGKNLKYYRLKKNMTKTELASLCGLTPMAISNYESGKRKPDMDIMKRLAEELGVTVSDFLITRNENLVFSHGEFRTCSGFTTRQKDYVKEAAEVYFNRFAEVVEALGGEVLPDAPECHSLSLHDDAEYNAKQLRHHLNIAGEGPINNLIGVLENKGLLVYPFDYNNHHFLGMNGTVNDRPYIVVNANLDAKQKKLTVVHELAHLMFIWPEIMSNAEIEKSATEIAGAFLLPKTDAKRELGMKRNAITKDMELVCSEYGISMDLLAHRANETRIVSDYVIRNYYFEAHRGRRSYMIPSTEDDEKATLLQQLVYRAVCEDEISVQKGAELLQVSYQDIVSHCYYAGE